MRTLRHAALALGLLFASTVSGDEINPAMLQVTERTGGWVDVTPAPGMSPTRRSFMAFAYVPGLGMVIHGGQQSSTPCKHPRHFVWPHRPVTLPRRAGLRHCVA